MQNSAGVTKSSVKRDERRPATLSQRELITLGEPDLATLTDWIAQNDKRHYEARNGRFGFLLHMV